MFKTMNKNQRNKQKANKKKKEKIEERKKCLPSNVEKIYFFLFI